MHSKKPFYILVALLFIAGIASSVFRGIEHNVPFLPGKQVQSWAVEAKVSFQGTGEPAEVSFSLPNDPAFEILVENASSPGFGLTITDDPQNKRAIWSIRSANGRQDLYYKVTLIPTGITTIKALGTPDVANTFIWPATEKVAAEQAIEEVWAKSATNLSFAQQLNKAFNAEERSQNIELLLSSNSPSKLLYTCSIAKGSRLK